MKILSKTHFKIIFLILLFSWKTQAQVIIDEKFEELRLSSHILPVFVDSTNEMGFKEARLQKYTEFVPDVFYKKQSRKKFYTYWHRFSVVNHSVSNTSAILEIMWFSIESFDLHIVTKDSVLSFRQGKIYPFKNRQFSHKNFAFKIPFHGYDTTYVYFKKPNGVARVNEFLRIKSVNNFFDFANAEYLFLGIFYGILIFVSLYNLLAFIILLNSTYLFYFLAILFFALHSLSSHDGIGFQYIWPQYPFITEFLSGISHTIFIISFIAYYRSLLSIPDKYPKLDRLIMIIIIVRALWYLTSYIHVKFTYYYWPFDLFIITLIYATCLYMAFIKDKTTYFPLLGLTFILIGFVIKQYVRVNSIQASIFIYYAQYIGIAIELLFLTYAMAEKVKLLGLESLLYDKKLKQKEIDIIEGLNIELESKVQIRTTELEQSNKQLDEFSYKIAHDIKSPLNTIIGLSEVYKMETDPLAKLELVEKIRICAFSLKDLTTNLLEHTKVSLNEINFESLNINDLINHVKNQLSFMPNYNRLSFFFEGDEVNDYLSDKILLSSIFQNILENSIKYLDLKKGNNFIHITITSWANEIKICFLDNGIGIPKEKIDQVFDIFYRVNPSDNKGTGLGMYFIYKSIHKLKGSIKVESTFGLETKIEITLPR